MDNSVRAMIKRRLEEMGADGLYNGSCQCGCGWDDLCPCRDVELDECVPAVRLSENRELFVPLETVGDVYDRAASERACSPEDLRRVTAPSIEILLSIGARFLDVGVHPQRVEERLKFYMIKLGQTWGVLPP